MLRLMFVYVLINKDFILFACESNSDLPEVQIKQSGICDAVLSVKQIPWQIRLARISLPKIYLIRLGAFESITYYTRSFRTVAHNVSTFNASIDSV